MAPSMINITVTVPEGTSNHGDPDLLCLPTKWTDIAVFYAVNYLAHAVTVKGLPGEKMSESAYFIVMALIYPYSGLIRGIEAITRRTAWRKGNELQRAVMAGALCVVVRDKDWMPLDGQVVENVEFWRLPRSWTRPQDEQEAGPEGENGVALENIEASNAQPTCTWSAAVPGTFYEGYSSSPLLNNRRNVHGCRYLPPGYTLAYLPSNTNVETIRGDAGEIAISSSYNLIKAVVSVIQLGFASTTLYTARGDQLNKYGYAAFGLTVLPYIIMSIVNLLGNALTPDFSTMYLVRSAEMTEAEDPRRGGWFDGVTGVVVNDTTASGVSLRFVRQGDEFLIHPVQPSQAGSDAGDARSHQSNNNIGHDLPLDQSDQIEEHAQINTGDSAEQGTQAPEVGSGSTQEPSSHPPPPHAPPPQDLKRPEQMDDLEDLTTLSQTIFRGDLTPVDQGVDLGPAQMYAQTNNLRHGLPTKWMLRDVPGRPQIHLRIPAATKFERRGHQAWSSNRVLIWTMVAFYMSFIPIAVIGGLTHFKPRQSTKAQRVWLMGWLIFGTVFGAMLPMTIGPFVNVYSGVRLRPGVSISKVITQWFIRVELLGFYAAFAIGGLVVVGQQLKSYGSCSKLD